MLRSLKLKVQFSDSSSSGSISAKIFCLDIRSSKSRMSLSILFWTLVSNSGPIPQRDSRSYLSRVSCVNMCRAILPESNKNCTALMFIWQNWGMEGVHGADSRTEPTFWPIDYLEFMTYPCLWQAILNFVLDHQYEVPVQVCFCLFLDLIVWPWTLSLNIARQFLNVGLICKLQPPSGSRSTAVYNKRTIYSFGKIIGNFFRGGVYEEVPAQCLG